MTVLALRRGAFAGFFTLLGVLILSAEASATPFSASVVLCLGPSVIPGACTVVGGPGHSTAENNITSSFVLLQGVADLTFGTIDVIAHIEPDHPGTPPISAVGQFIDTIFLAAPSGTPRIDGTIHIDLENGLFEGPTAFSALVRSPERGNSSGPFCSDGATNTYTSGRHEVNIPLTCRFSVRPNLFFSDHVDFHLPFEAFVQVFANGSDTTGSTSGRGTHASFDGTAILGLTIDTPGVTFTSESGVLLTAPPSTSEVPEPATILLLGSGLAVRFGRRRSPMASRPRVRAVANRKHNTKVTTC